MIAMVPDRLRQVGRPLVASLSIAAAAALASAATSADQEAATGLSSGDRSSELRFENPAPGGKSTMIGQDARLQLVVTAQATGGEIHDATRAVSFAAAPVGVLHVAPHGLATPLGNGTAIVTATDAQGQTAEATVEVTRFSDNRPLSFPTQVVPLFTKMGCNGGGCHGKASGQNGFRLSLLGFGPRDDYVHLVHESRGRRVFPAAPDRSLLLMKATNATPHGGGQRMVSDSHEYRVLRRWIAQGMPYGDGREPTVVGIDVTPQQRRLFPSSSQQLAVVARYSDGTTQDITRAAQYDSNDPDMAEVSEDGYVQLRDVAGDVAVMARYQGHVTVFRADIPWTQETDRQAPQDWPEPRNIVDEAVFNKLRSLGISLSSPCGDDAYLRRLTLDIAGRLPTLAEVEQFNSDQGPDRREALLERLLASDDYADFFANKWNAILRNRRSSEQSQFGAWVFHGWIRDCLAENRPYDEFVRDIITASGSMASNPPVVWYRQVPDVAERAEDAAQLFLGQRIRCARCHHHPYEKWSQSDYTQMSAFFAGVVQKIDQGPFDLAFVSRVGPTTAPHPKTGKPLPPAGLDGSTAPIGPTDDPRERLVDWMVERDNPFFAKALVNRYWKHFLGRGLVEPEDDLRVTNPPSNPELLDGLAHSFIESGYDLKALIRTICQSHVYGLDSEPAGNNLLDRRSFSRFYPKRLTAEVLLDAVDDVTFSKSEFAGVPSGTRAVALPDPGFESYFLTLFGRPNAATACECERVQEASLAQSLHLLNSDEIQAKLSADGGRAALLAGDQSRSVEAKVSELYLRGYSRPPRDDELQAALAYLAEKENPRHAYEDLVWSLINSKEFMFNH